MWIVETHNLNKRDAKGNIGEGLLGVKQWGRIEVVETGGQI